MIQYLYQKYGRERAGLAAEVITYRSRSAIRDVGKALGLSLDRVDALAKQVEGYTHEPQLEDRCRQVGTPAGARQPGCATVPDGQSMARPLLSW